MNYKIRRRRKVEIKLIGTGSIGALESSASTLINKEILIDMPNGIVKRIKQLGENVLNIKVQEN